MSIHFRHLAVSKWPLLFCLCVFSCKQKQATTVVRDAGDTIISVDSFATETDSISTPEDSVSAEIIPVKLPKPAMKKPAGMYRIILTEAGEPRIEQTISFENHNYLLQERYLNAKDSVVLTEGSWAVSDGFIWLYRDQLAAGRYAWKGEELQYYDPVEKKRLAMEKLTPIAHNEKLMAKKNEGIVFFGVGNEPFWNVQLERGDSLRFSLAEWPQALKMKLASAELVNDSTIYLAENDSARLRVVLLPYFCSDGMSDFTYSYQVQAHFNGHVYKGCAIVYKNR